MALVHLFVSQLIIGPFSFNTYFSSFSFIYNGSVFVQNRNNTSKSIDIWESYFIVTAWSCVSYYTLAESQVFKITYGETTINNTILSTKETWFFSPAVREDRMPGGRNSGAVYNLYKVIIISLICCKLDSYTMFSITIITIVYMYNTHYHNSLLAIGFIISHFHLIFHLFGVGWYFDPHILTDIIVDIDLDVDLAL